MRLHDYLTLKVTKAIIATFKPVVLSGKIHLKQDGTSNVKIRIYHNRELQYFSTKYYIEPNLIDKSDNR